MMTLFIFEPYEWDYCGGTLAVIAEDYDQAIQLLLEVKDDGGEPLFERSFFSKDTKSFGHSYDQWILTHQLELKLNLKSEVIVNNWNYA